MQSAINEKTASLKAHLETLKLDNARLTEELKSYNTNYTKIIILFVLALLIGLGLAKFL